jgi:serine/threonine protein kinase
MPRLKFKIDEFELGRQIGQGTVGEIFLARQLATGKTVALKILMPSFSQDRLIRSRFVREMQILEKLRHPHIVEVYGSGEVGGRLFYVMEFVDAGSVKELLANYGLLPWQEVASIARQICSALQYMHNHGIIHRDLKPANVFLTRDGEVKLGDFGIARDMQTKDFTDQGITVGTHAYMSPEQITASKSINEKTDLYALGCVLFEMLTGRPPYQAAHIAELFDMHLRGEIPRVRDTLPQIPEKLDEIIASLMHKKPEDRPFNARTVQGIMSELLAADGQAEASTDTGQQMLSERLQFTPVEKPLSWPIAVGLLVAGLAVVVVSVLIQRWVRVDS